MTNEKELGFTSTGSVLSGAAKKYSYRALWESLTVTVVALCAVGAGIFGLWATSTSTIKQEFRHYLVSLAQTAAALVDPTLHDSIRRPDQLNDPDYRRAVEPLRRMRKAVSDVHYIYTVVYDDSRIRFVLDAADPESKTPDGQPEQSGVWGEYEPSTIRLADRAVNADRRHSPILQALGADGERGVAAAHDQPVSDSWGQFMSGFAPIFDAKGRQIGAVGVDVDASVYVARLARARNWSLFGLAPASILIGLMGITFYRVRVRGLADAQAAIDSAEAAEEAALILAAERQRLSAVIEGTDVGIWEWDRLTDSLVVDQRWAAMIGYRSEDLSPLTTDKWQSLVHPEDLPAVQQAIAESITALAAVFACEYRLRHVDGYWVWVLAHGRVMQSDDQDRPFQLAGIHLNVSAQKSVELSLKESETKFRSLFELSPVGIALNDLRTGRFLQVNDAMVTPTGYTREQLLQMTYRDIKMERDPDEQADQIESIERTDRFGPYEIRHLRKDGTNYPVLLSGIRMMDAFGRSVAWSIAQDITQRKVMELALLDAARRDKLTGLANRALFMERLHTAVNRVNCGEQALYAVLFLDFDRFKLVNDTLGHDAGDELLRRIASRLRAALRATDTTEPIETGNTVARFGGDEFLILINDSTMSADIDAIIERLLAILEPPYDIFGTEVHSTASIGVVTSEQPATTAENIVRNADVAMYEAKRSGRARAVSFNEAMRTRLTRKVAIESSLHKAIGTDQFRLVFQPIIDLDSGELDSVEALVRWDHPELGAIAPTEFIPIAEESELIATLGRWVLEEASRAFVRWHQLDPRRAPSRVSVNISRSELARGVRLPNQILDTLKRAGMDPACLQLEVTERDVMSNPEVSLEFMRELRRQGVSLALDGFGTGTSSLRILREYPFDTIKIDRSFVKDVGTNHDLLAVIHATVALIENLGMASLAEGVEEAEQLAVLQSLGCRYAQGLLFGSPVEVAQLMDACWRPGDDFISRTGTEHGLA